jgi:uncharacterized protein YdeI (YjbR/CyaY-like superfamily)
MEMHKSIKAVKAKTSDQWRDWLRVNHKKEDSVWLILFHKKSSIPSIYYAEAVEQAICFGWIDSIANKRDDESSYQYFSKRKPKSNWSKINRERAEKMSANGLMDDSGIEMIQLAKETGTWEALRDVQDNVIPDDLQTELNKSKKALHNFNAFPPSSKRGILEWILNAKKPETRKKRIRETVSLAAKNIKANHYRQ